MAPKLAPRWRQNGPRWPQDGSKTAPDGPKMAQDGSNGRPGRPKTPPRRPPESSQSAPRPLSDAARQPFGLPGLQKHPKRPQNGPQESSIGTKICQRSPNCSRAHWGNAQSTTLAQLSLSASPQTSGLQKTCKNNMLLCFTFVASSPSTMSHNGLSQKAGGGGDSP